MELLSLIISFFALLSLEIVLGIDNIVFLSLFTKKLPKAMRDKARRWGLTFAWITRLLLLALAFQLVSLTQPMIRLAGFTFSCKDIVLLLGGIFLVSKATQEIYDEMAVNKGFSRSLSAKKTAFFTVVCQIALMDIVFSLDSVLTALGLARDFLTMALAISGAIVVMLYASKVVSDFIEKKPVIKLLALGFLIIIGMVLMADGFHFHIPRGYLYMAMSFSLVVILWNFYKDKR